MIVKSMARKSVTFGQVLAYINRPQAKGPAILHNLATNADDVSAIHREYLDNSRYVPRRKNGNLLYHEVMSFGAGDRRKLTPAMIEDLVRRYLELRGPGLLGYAKAHLDRTCTHVHLLLSANNIASSSRLRLSRSRFLGIVAELERYQRSRFPQLDSSLAQAVRKETKSARLTRREVERARRLLEQGNSAVTRKETVRDVVREQILAARSEESLLLRLEMVGLELYVRGASVGVLDRRTGRRLRLKTLGLAPVLAQQLASWERERGRLDAVERVERERAQREWLERGFREEMILALAAQDGPPGGELRRLQYVAGVLRQRAERERRVREDRVSRD